MGLPLLWICRGAVALANHSSELMQGQKLGYICLQLNGVCYKREPRWS